MKSVRKIVLIFNVLWVVLTLLAYLSPWIDPGIIWHFTLLGLFLPLMLLIHLAFIFYWLTFRWFYSLFSVAVVLLGGPSILLIFALNGDGPDIPADFSLATYNMNYAYGTYAPGTYRFDENRTAAFESFIEKELHTDILCAQESNQRIRELLQDFYPYRHVLKNAGTSIYSHFPIVKKGQIDFGTKTNSCVWADIRIEKDTIRFYSLHLQSNRISSDADRILENAETGKQVDMINLRTIFSKYKRYVVIRSQQARQIRDHIKLSPHPVIVAGDLNDPPVSYSHRILSEGRKDAFVEAGNGLGITYAGKIPLLRIDNILIPKEMMAISHQTIRKKHSDHYPVVCAIKLP